MLPRPDLKGREGKIRSTTWVQKYGKDGRSNLDAQVGMAESSSRGVALSAGYSQSTIRLLNIVGRPDPIPCAMSNFIPSSVTDKFLSRTFQLSIE